MSIPFRSRRLAGRLLVPLLIARPLAQGPAAVAGAFATGHRPPDRTTA